MGLDVVDAVFRHTPLGTRRTCTGLYGPVRTLHVRNSLPPDTAVIHTTCYTLLSQFNGSTTVSPMMKHYSEKNPQTPIAPIVQNNRTPYLLSNCCQETCNKEVTVLNFPPLHYSLQGCQGYMVMVSQESSPKVFWHFFQNG